MRSRSDEQWTRSDIGHVPWFLKSGFLTKGRRGELRRVGLAFGGISSREPFGSGPRDLAGRVGHRVGENRVAGDASKVRACTANGGATDLRLEPASVGYVSVNRWSVRRFQHDLTGFDDVTGATFVSGEAPGAAHESGAASGFLPFTGNHGIAAIFGALLVVLLGVVLVLLDSQRLVTPRGLHGSRVRRSSARRRW
jgi:hypothetical protein